VRHQIAGRKLGRSTAHRMLMLRSMVTDFIRHETVRITDSKAKEVRRMAEKVITLGKKRQLTSQETGLSIANRRVHSKESV